MQLIFKDESNVVFRATTGKWQAVVVEISRMNKTGRPVLVGATSVEQSDSLSGQLKKLAIGAISCMIKRPTDGKLIGYNVDYLGAIAAIEEGLQGSKLFLAYGGSAKGARVVLANPTSAK
ncbi:hypothetical protein V2J09_022085 [Rumex salicifolius]